MSKLRAILEKINDLESTIAQVEKDFGATRDLASELSLLSLHSRREMLDEELNEITKAGQVEICDYRIIPASKDSYAVAAVSSALHDFQDLVTLVFESLVSKPKPLARVSPDIFQKTQFEFGFAYSGSLGIVLTIPNDRMLLDEQSKLDEAVSSVFNLLKIQTKEEVRMAAQKYGTSTVRKLHHWTKAHSQYGMTADIKWKRESKVRREVISQPPEMELVAKIIEERGDPVSEVVSLSGTLVAWDIPHRTFAMEFTDEGVIAGKWSDSFKDSAPKMVASRYIAKLTKHVVTRYAEDRDDIRWVLDSLETDG